MNLFSALTSDSVFAEIKAGGIHRVCIYTEEISPFSEQDVFTGSLFPGRNWDIALRRAPMWVAGDRVGSVEYHGDMWEVFLAILETESRTNVCLVLLHVSIYF